MEVPEQAFVQKTKQSCEIQAAFQCQNCFFQITTIGFKLIVPDLCGNCDTAVFKRLWAQKLSIQTVVTPI